MNLNVIPKLIIARLKNVMAELLFDRQKTFEYPPQLCDTLCVGPKGKFNY